MHDEHDCYDLATRGHERGPLEDGTTVPRALVLRRVVARPGRRKILAPAAFFFAAWALGVWAHAMLF